ncbi:MAG: WYL domain-containing protein [Ilumatobacter fluminis]|uniref:helix-turn-helix transcriptional regulator n=1 Tax=Ilumatobacter fluminis TaxID=467091 RepID=UPI0032ECF13F
MADRVERLTNLLALLLETRQPLSLTQIADELVGQYPDKAGARRGAFERDKAALRDIGVPIEQEILSGTDQAGQTRYWIDRDRYELQGLELDPDETRALQVAMAATRPGSSSGQEAMWKIGGGVLDSGAAVAAVVPDAAALPALREAVSGGASVRFRYRDVDRRVDPWGVLLRSGFWYLVGHDHERDARRTYRIDRIDGDVTLDGPATVVRPDDFDPRDAVPDDPKLIGASGDVTEATVRIDAGRAATVIRELGDDRVLDRTEDGAVVVRVPCANLPAFRSWVLGFVDHAEVLGPDDVRADVIGWLEAMA